MAGVFFWWLGKREGPFLNNTFCLETRLGTRVHGDVHGIRFPVNTRSREGERAFKPSGSVIKSFGDAGREKLKDTQDGFIFAHNLNTMILDILKMS